MAAVLLGVIFLASCAGEGPGEVDGGPGELAPNLLSLQDNVFGVTCAQPGCHIGPSAPEGLMMDTLENSFNNLVGVSSRQVPSLLRVDPGNPEESYIVWKLEGRSGIVGGRMPLNLTPLRPEEINAIRQWIQAGAPFPQEMMAGP